MGSNTSPSLSLLLLLNVLFFTVVSSTYLPCPPPPPPKNPCEPKYPPVTPKYPPKYPPVTPKYPPKYPPVTPKYPPQYPPVTPKYPPVTPKYPPQYPPVTPKYPPVTPKYPPVIPYNPYPVCPRDALKLGVCTDLLGLVHIVIGAPLDCPCCSLISGLVDLEAATCVCSAIKANVLGINLNIDHSLNLVLNACGRTLPPGFECGY